MSTPAHTSSSAGGGKKLPPDMKEVKNLITQGKAKGFLTVEEVNELKGKVKVSMIVFGRPTAVELEYWLLEKA